MPDVRVPQKAGSISVSLGGDDPITYSVSDHVVKVGEDKIDRFVAAVEGAERVGAPKK